MLNGVLLILLYDKNVSWMYLEYLQYFRVIGDRRGKRKFPVVLTRLIPLRLEDLRRLLAIV